MVRAKFKMWVGVASRGQETRNLEILEKINRYDNELRISKMWVGVPTTGSPPRIMNIL